MMKEQQEQESREMHTMQIFREASSCKPCHSTSHSDRQSPRSITSIKNSMSVTPIFDERDEVADGIGSDWAIEMDEDIIEEPSTPLQMTELNSEGESSLYSFYFETPIVSMGQDETSDDFTITSHDTNSFHDSNHFDSDMMDDIWEQGLDRSLSSSTNKK
eukprot:jgi/Psemu1/286448/fgenesh1_pg.134_\